MADQEELGLAAGRRAFRAVFLVRAEGLVALGRLACGALIKFRVCVAELDGDVSEPFLIVANSLNSDKGSRYLR